MNLRRTQIAYRCPECTSLTVGFLGGLTAAADMLRLRCDCGASALDIKKRGDGGIHLSVPCVYCKDNHGLDLSSALLERDRIIRLPCPYSGMGILFIGDEEEMESALAESADELSRVMSAFEAETVSDIQPEDDDGDSAPDPAIYDTFNFLLRDLESEGGVKCPCECGEYDLRFIDGGIQIYCKNCGASRDFHAASAASAEEYLTLDEITLA